MLINVILPNPDITIASFPGSTLQVFAVTPGE
jgi:hypothetical protein